MNRVRKISKKYYVRQIMACWLACYMLFGMPIQIARALPTEGVFTEGGTGVIDEGILDPLVTSVTVGQAVSFIEWGAPGSPGTGGIDTASDESLTFLHGGNINSAVLNKVKSGNLTHFDGTLNGVDMRIFIINPAGIIFGDGARINTSQLVASGLNMSNFIDFANNVDDKMVFSGGGGTVTVNGVLDATGTGSLYFVGHDVFNNGAILCPDGLVVMAAGDTLRLGQPGSSTSVIVETADLVDVDRYNNIENSGTVGEEGNPVAKLVLAAGDVWSQAIENVGELAVVATDDISISGDVTVAGDITLTAGSAYGDNNIDLYGDVTSDGELIITADDDIYLGGDATAAGNMDITAGGSYNDDIDIVGKLITTEGSGGNVTVEAGRDITFGGGITADGAVEVLGGQYSPYSGYFSSADIHINGDITATSMRIKNGKDVYPGEESHSGIYVADGMNLEATAGDVVVEAVHDIILGGYVEATGNIFLNGDEDGYGNPGDPEGYHPRAYGGGDVIAGDLTAGGSIEVKGNAIKLNGDVSANGGDLTITGRTSRDTGSEGGLDVEWGYIDVAADKTLYASYDVILIDAFGSGGDEPPAGKMELTGHGSLTIEAEGGEIITQNLTGDTRDRVKITVTGSTLTMKQDDPLNLGLYTFGNQENTDLTLVSYNNSVTAVDFDNGGKNENAADQWASITATAEIDITLQGHDASRDITAGALTSNATGFDTGNITVTSDNSKVLLTQNVSANQGSVAVTAIDGGIVSSGNITATDGITLFGEVTADKDGPQTFDAGHGTLWAKETLSTITKTGTGGLTLGGDTLVDLDGIDGSTGDSVWVQAGPLTIEDSLDAEGNLKAQGIIHLQGTTNNVAGDILSTGSGIIFDHDVTADGAGSQTFDAGSEQLIAENSADIDKSTAGSLTLAGDAGIELGGNVTGTGMTSVDSLVFENNVTADGTADAQDQRFDAGLGALNAVGSIAKTSDGKLNLGGEEGIELGGNVETHDGDLTFEDAVTASGGDQRFDADGAGTDLIADDIIKTTPGNLTLGAGTQPDAQIELAGDVTTTDGHLIFWDKVIANGSGDQVFDADGAGTDLIADDDIIKTNNGSLTLGAGTQHGAKIYLAGDVKTSNGDLIFWDKVIANDTTSDQVFDADGAGTDLIADDDIIKTTPGSLTLGAGTQPDAEIYLAGDVKTTDGDLIFWDDVIADGTCSNRNQLFDADMGQDSYENDLVALGNITKTTPGRLTLDGGAGDSKIYVAGDVSTSDGSLIFEDDVIANGTGDQTFTAGPFSGFSPLSRLKVYGSVTKQDGGDTGIDFDGGSLTLESGWKIDIDGDITVDDGDLTVEADQHILVGGSVLAKGDILIRADKDLDAEAHQGDPLYGGDVDVDGDITSTQGSIDVYSTDFTTYLGGDVDAAYDVTLHNSTILDGEGDQTVEAGILGDGTLTAGSWMWKTTEGNLYLIGNNDDPDHRDGKAIDLQYAGCLPAASTSLGNLEISAENGDIQISGDLTTFGLWCGGEPGPRLQVSNGDGDFLDGWYERPTGGVSVIAENGKIYTEGASPENDTLNIGIVGNSDHYQCLGVDLPWGEEGKAAIVVLSKDDLIFGPDTMLIARGNYYDAGGKSIWDFIDFADVDSYDDYFAIFDNLFDEQLGGCIAGQGAFCSAVYDFLGDLDEAEFDFGDPDAFKVLFTDFVGEYFEDLLIVDDRAAVNFLDTPDTMIGGATRNQGDAIDVAVYLASTEGDVHLDGRAIDVAENGTMVVDAYDTVTFGDFETFNFDNFDLSGDDFDSCVDFGCLMIKLMLRFSHDIMEDFTCEDLELAAIDYFGDIDAAHTFLYDLMNDPEANKGTLGDFLNFFFGDGYFFNIDRLEVVSRVTEWLYQAASTGNGTLPYAGDAGAIAAFEDFIGGDYILRGAGLGNPDITDGRAWVLENPAVPEPLDVLYSPQISGCPAAMQAVANELAVAEQTLQISIGGMLALNPTIQPCNACAGLLNAAAILRDEDGSRMAALIQVFNEQAPANVPFSPAMATSIVTAFADQLDDASQSNYAAAMEYVDTFVQYVAILDTQLGSPVEDSTAFVMTKYGAGITESENSNIAAFVAARLAGLETF